MTDNRIAPRPAAKPFTEAEKQEWEEFVAWVDVWIETNDPAQADLSAERVIAARAAA